MDWRFISILRHKFLISHRINRCIIIMVLVFLLNIGALMIGRRSFGGGLDTQSAVGLLAILTTESVCMAYYDAKRLPINQHLVWMLRAMFYLGTSS
jgi:hypothetical protein